MRWYNVEHHNSGIRKLIPALALVVALIETPDSGKVIGAGELTTGSARGDCLRTRAQRLYAAAAISETVATAASLTKIKGGKLIDRDGVQMDSLTPRLVTQKGRAGLTIPDAVRKDADVLAHFD